MLGTVSIIVPCFNAAPFVRETLNSTLSQTHPPLEVIVVDDGSTDDTAAVAETFGPSITFHRFVKNCGKPAALNWALERARGSYILVLDADDILLDKCLATLAAFLDGHPEIDVAFGHASLFRDNDVVAERHPVVEDVKAVPGRQVDKWMILDSEAFFDASLDKSLTPQGATLYRRSCFEKIGNYNDSCPCSQDWEMHARLSRCFVFAFLDEVLIRMRRHDNNISISDTFLFKRFQGRVRGRERLLRELKMTNIQRQRVLRRVIQLKSQWARELTKIGETRRARDLFRELHTDAGWRLGRHAMVSRHLPAATLRDVAPPIEAGNPFAWARTPMI